MICRSISPTAIFRQEQSVNKKLIVLHEKVKNDKYVQELTIGDLMNTDFERVMEEHEPFTFYLHYSTVKGDALGKLTLTDFELIFEPLNPRFKGFANPESEIIR